MPNLDMLNTRRHSIYKILRFWKKQPKEAEYFFVCTKNRKTDEWHDGPFPRSLLSTVPMYIEDNLSKEIYVCPRGFTRPKRKARFAVDGPMFYADCDEIDVYKLKSAATYMVETSPGRFSGIWLTDKPVTEEQNKRFTKLIKADPSGYDKTQCLRLVAGTRNYKYSDRPYVEIAWCDEDAVYQLRAIERLLPKATVRADVEDCCRKLKRYSRDVAKQIAMACKMFSKWSQRVTAENKRSDAIWYFGMTALEHGYSPSKACCVVEYSMAFIEKYEGRPRDAERELERLFDKWSRHHAQLRKQLEDA